MKITMRSVLLSSLAASGFAMIACSLSVPSEDAVFGKYTAGSGGKLGSSGGTSSSGGSGENLAGGTADGGTPGAGTGGTSPIAGTSSGGHSTGGSAPSGGAGGEAGAPDIVLPPATLVIHYKFDSISSAATVVDATGNGKDATVTGNPLPTVVAGHIDSAIRLDASKQQYVQLPGDILKDMDAVSISCWLELESGAVWDRLFDFNATGAGNWFYFSPTGWNSTKMAPGTHIAVKGPFVDPEMMLTEVFPVGTWHHVAVVLAPPYLRYYLDGKLKSEFTNMTVAPKDVGSTYQNWIGRSPYTGDPYLNGLVDDFRIYSGALKDSEVKDLAAQ